MGIPRSQLFSLALEEYVFNHSKSAITQKLNEVYGSVQGDEVLEPGLTALREATEHDTW